MGMDVYGKAPKSEQGKYFRRNVWGWHPLADYCQKVAPEICSRCESWHTNDGEGLNEADALLLAMALQAQVNTNACLMYQQRSTERFEVETVIEFIAFLRDSGGFEIC